MSFMLCSETSSTGDGDGDGEDSVVKSIRALLTLRANVKAFTR